MTEYTVKWLSLLCITKSISIQLRSVQYELLARYNEPCIHPRQSISMAEILARRYFRFETILVTACLMMTPAFSVSFLVNPLVMHTFSAGIGCQPASLGFTPSPRGNPFSLVMRTPFARHYTRQQCNTIRKGQKNPPRQRRRAESGSGHQC